MGTANNKLDNSYTWKWMPAIDRVYYRNINYGVKDSMRLYCSGNPISTSKANCFYNITAESSLKFGYDYIDNSEIINNGMFMPVDFYEHNSSNTLQALCRVLTKDGEKAIYLHANSYKKVDDTHYDVAYFLKKQSQDYYAIRRIWVASNVNIEQLVIIDHNHNKDVHKWLVDMADWLNAQSTATQLQLGAYYLSLLTDEEKKKFTDKGWVLA